MLGVIATRRLVAACLVAAGFASVLAAACSDATDAPSSVADSSTADTAAPDARRPLPDAEDVTCDAGDASTESPPAPYAGRTNPVAGQRSAINAGQATFGVRCAFCHGPVGKGDGPEGPKHPPPADLTAKRRDDDFLLWRISTGGRDAPHCSAMPAFAASLTETQRWQLVAFVRTLEPAAVADAGADADAGD